MAAARPAPTQPPEPFLAVTLTDVTKRFGGQAAFDAVSVDIVDGEFFVVLAPSGRGKSTLLRLVAGLERLDGG